MRENTLKKMETSLADVVQYYLEVNGVKYMMNDLIGSQIKLTWSGEVICICGRRGNKFYRSGFCYNCYWESPQASQSIFKPELCTAHLDIEERDLEWEKNFQLAPHYVYLANSSGIKVGITRESQGVVRWMDQGASQAIILAKVPIMQLLQHQARYFLRLLTGIAALIIFIAPLRVTFITRSHASLLIFSNKDSPPSPALLITPFKFE